MEEALPDLDPAWSPGKGKKNLGRKGKWGGGGNQVRDTAGPSPVPLPCSSLEGRLGRVAKTRRNRRFGRRVERKKGKGMLYWSRSGQKPVLVSDT